MNLNNPVNQKYIKIWIITILLLSLIYILISQVDNKKGAISYSHMNLENSASLSSILNKTDHPPPLFTFMENYNSI